MDYLKINKDTWNKKTALHVASDFYNMKAFMQGENSLKEIELALLGDVKGKNILHLQCHFGQDSISLARLGANVTAIDLSDVAIEKAKALAEEMKVNVDFICCNVYDALKFCDKQFDIVFTSYGVIGWLPDLEKWTHIVSQFLKPKGQFVFVEFHPVVWMFDNDLKEVAYSYFKDEAIVETEKGTYADRAADIEQTSITWNHGLSEVIQNLLKQGLEIISFEEFNYSPYNCMTNMEEIGKNQFQVKHFGNKIPLVYALSAIKK